MNARRTVRVYPSSNPTGWDFIDDHTAEKITDVVTAELVLSATDMSFVRLVHVDTRHGYPLSYWGEWCVALVDASGLGAPDYPAVRGGDPRKDDGDD